MGMPVNDGAELPPEPEARWYEVILPTPIAPFDGVLLGDRFFGAWLHWESLGPKLKGVSVPCTRDEHCVRCKAGLPSRWMGYIAALRSRDRKEAVLNLTEGAARQLLPFLTKYGTLRGLHCVFARRRVLNADRTVKVNAPVDVKLIARIAEERLPAEFPIHDSLSRLWGINSDFLKRRGQREDHRLTGLHYDRAVRFDNPPEDPGCMIPVA